LVNPKKRALWHCVYHMWWKMYPWINPSWLDCGDLAWPSVSWLSTHVTKLPPVCCWKGSTTVMYPSNFGMVWEILVTTWW
jgi:hypothetical protein